MNPLKKTLFIGCSRYRLILPATWKVKVTSDEAWNFSAPFFPVGKLGKCIPPHIESIIIERTAKKENKYNKSLRKEKLCMILAVWPS